MNEKESLDKILALMDELRDEINNNTILAKESNRKRKIQITELKERFETYRLINNDDVRNMKEVLQDTIKECSPHYIIKNKLLEKLDSGKEKKEVVNLGALKGSLKKDYVNKGKVLKDSGSEMPSENLRICSECQKIFESIELRKEHEQIIHGIGKPPEPKESEVDRLMKLSGEKEFLDKFDTLKEKSKETEPKPSMICGDGSEPKTEAEKTFDFVNNKWELYLMLSSIRHEPEVWSNNDIQDLKDHIWENIIDKELIEEFLEEKKELEKDLRHRWSRLGWHVHVEKKNHIRSVNDTYQGYLMAIHIWKMYRIDYYSKRSGRRG